MCSEDRAQSGDFLGSLPARVTLCLIPTLVCDPFPASSVRACRVGPGWPHLSPGGDGKVWPALGPESAPVPLPAQPQPWPPSWGLRPLSLPWGPVHWALLAAGQAQFGPGWGPHTLAAAPHGALAS